MTLIIDLDDTLILYPDSDLPPEKRGGKERYDLASPNHKEIVACNYYYNKGHTIIIFTGRNWDQYNITIDQLKKFNIKYHELIMGKPQGIYIDSDSKTSLLEL